MSNIRKHGVYGKETIKIYTIAFAKGIANLPLDFKWESIPGEKKDVRLEVFKTPITNAIASGDNSRFCHLKTAPIDLKIKEISIELLPDFEEVTLSKILHVVHNHVH
jgi:hypothetical protein